MAKKKIATDERATAAAGGTPGEVKGVTDGKNLEKARAERKAKADTTRYFYVEESKTKLAPQAQEIVKTIQEMGTAGVLRNDLVEALKGRLKTRQPEERILSYYQKALIESGAIRTQSDAVAA